MLPIYIPYLDVFFDAWLCLMSWKMILDNQDADISMVFLQCVTACVFSDFLAWKMLYYILETAKQKT